jgi:dipeptidyl aminopeptidase/acylaminoacyl peptidase
MRYLVLAGMLLCAGISQAATAVDVADFAKRDQFDDIKLSPGGDYYAASVPAEEMSGLVIVRRADNKVTATFGRGQGTYIADFSWVSPRRVLVGTARKFGTLDTPALTGNLYGVDIDGSHNDILVGQDVKQADPGSMIQTRKVEAIAAFLLDPLDDDDRNVLISVRGFGPDAYSRVERMDVYTGRRTPVARSPVRNSDYVTDSKGVVRFAVGHDLDNNNRLFHRDANASDWTRTSDWTLVNDEHASHHVEIPLGFAADGRTAYLQVEQAAGPDAIVALDTASGARRTLVQDAVSDPISVIWSMGHPSVPVGVFLGGGTPRSVFFDPEGTEARLHRSLEAAFAGQEVHITSKTGDGTVALVQVSSDRDAGGFYLFDTVAKAAAGLVSRRPWSNPAQMGEMRPVQLSARDGLALHGFLTMPAGSGGKRLPMVVMPHGGPFFVADRWGFDPQVQLLAAAGYAVLQVNFRGSSGYGRSFEQAGARQWGGLMQDDVTDATRWGIEQGHADPARICIFGGSYGGYAALMGAAREPSLYRCAIGYAGVYDLPLMYEKGDVRESVSNVAYMRDWIGEPARIAAQSPVNLAAKIKVPVFLAAGGKDERAPIDHSERMERALRAAGIPVETLYYPTEGHGFFQDAHRQAFYTQLLAFLDRNIGNAGAAAGTPASASAAGH